MKVVCLLLLSAWAVPAFAQSPIDGKWQALFPNPEGGKVAVIFDLTADGTTLAGTVSNWIGTERLHEVSVQNGKVQGNIVTFNTFHPIPYLFGKFLAEWEAILMNWGAPLNRITGTATRDAITFIQRDWSGETIQFQAAKIK